MKRFLGIFSLGMLLFSLLMPSYTFAVEPNLAEVDLSEKLIADELVTNSIATEELSDDDGNSYVDNVDNVDGKVEYINQIDNELILSSEDQLSDIVPDKDNELDIEVLNSENDINWENCFERNGLYIKKYLCDNTEILVPEKAIGVFGSAFEGKTIDNITFLSSDTVLYQQIFSGAILQGKMTLPGNNYSQGYMLEGATIGENGEITLNQGMRTYHTNILGKVIVDGTKGNYGYLFQNSLIDGIVVLSGFSGTITHAFQGVTLTENGKIIIEDGIDKIYNSFQRMNGEGELLGTIILPDSIETIDQSFYGIPMISHIDFPKDLKFITNSFNSSEGYPIMFQSGIQFLGNQELLIDGAFNGTNVDGDFSINGSGISIKYLAPSSISGNVVISGEDVYIKDGSFYNYQFGGSIIDGYVMISGTNIGEMRGFSNVKIGEDLTIYGNSINLNYGLGSQPEIGGDVIVSGNTIEGKYSTFTAMNISGDALFYGDNLDFEYGFSPMNIDGNLEVKGNTVNLKSTFSQLSVGGNIMITGDSLNIMYNAFTPSNVNGKFDISGNTMNIMYSSLQGLSVLSSLNIIASDGVIGYDVLHGANIGGLFTLSGDYEYGPSILNNLRTQGFIINLPIPNIIKHLTGNLIINNADNAIGGTFSGAFVSDNIILNGEISKVGENAYAFSGGTIQPITLSANFNTGDIGENAFCINGKPVVAYTMKEVSQEDRNYLLQHACLDIKSAFNITFNVDGNIETLQYNGRNTDDIPSPTKNGYEFLGWFEENSETPFDFENTPITEDKTLFAKWKALEEKAQETAAQSVVYTNETTVTIGDDVQEEKINNSSLINLVSKEVESEEVETEEQKITVKESEIQVSSDKRVEYQGGLEVYLEKTENAGTEIEETKKIEGTAKFSSPVAVKIPITSNAEAVKVQVKHEGEEFGYKGLTTNPINSCVNGEAVNDKYNGESIAVKDSGEGKYALIYTCSASTFVAYTENKKSADNTAVATPSAGGGRLINTTSNTQDQEHNSADINEQKENKASTTTSGNTVTVEENIKKYGNIKLTRGEVAVMTNILLDVFPQLVEGKQELDDIENACSNYADEQKFTKDEKKAITRLCKLSIMGIHADNNRPLEEFLVNNNTTNDEFSKVINRSISTYNEKDLSTVKDALKKLENNEDDVVFGTLYDMFMSIKNVLN